MLIPKKLPFANQISIKRITVLALIIVFSASLYSFKKTQSECINPLELKDFTTGTEKIEVCGDKIYRGKTVVISKGEFPDLFEHKLNADSKSTRLKQYIRVFEKDKKEYVSIKSIIDYVSWNNSAIGIYRKTDDGYVEIFKRDFSDNQGRWVDIEFGEDYSYRDSYFYLNAHGEGLTVSGDIGYLGCYGACRLLWWDYYEWDSDKKTFALANNKHQEEFKKLLENYEDFDETKCQDEAGVDKSIPELYKTRKGKNKICNDDVVEPATTVEQAEILLKGMKAIEMILEGRNISISEVEKVEID